MMKFFEILYAAFNSPDFYFVLAIIFLLTFLYSICLIAVVLLFPDLFGF